MGLAVRIFGVALSAVLVNGCNRADNIPDRSSFSYSENRCGGPPASWKAPGSEFGELLLTNLLRVGPGGLTWNDKKITEDELAQHLTEADRHILPPGMSVVFERDTDCGTVDHIRQMIGEKLRCASGQVCVEYSEAEWAKMQPPPCDADCRALSRANGDFTKLNDRQRERLKANYTDKYGFVPW